MFVICFFLKLFVVAFAIQSASGILCYRCSGKTNADCGKTGEELAKVMVPVNCTNTHAVCLKGVDPNGVVSRTCSTLTYALQVSAKRPTGSHCLICATDKCNSSETVHICLAVLAFSVIPSLFYRSSFML